jgi:hypothetical protein
MKSLAIPVTKDFTVFHLAILLASLVIPGLATNAAAQTPRQIAPPPAAGSTRTGGGYDPAPTARAAPEAGQARRRSTPATICGNPNVPCRSEVTFQPYDLPFRLTQNTVIWESELFYAVILKSKPAPNDNCDIFISERDRLSAQALFPDRKVFASRCAEPESLFYTNTKRDSRIMAVYAGKTLAEANRVLGAVQATGKFPGANVRRMRTGFNGT